MPPMIMSSSKGALLMRWLLRSEVVRRQHHHHRPINGLLGLLSGWDQSHHHHHHHHRRSFGNVARVVRNQHRPSIIVGGSFPCNKSQTRCFLGCGDGQEEGDVLSKTYEERRVMGYTPEQLFAVVAAVDLYEDFVPWCQRSRIVKHNEDGSFNAELEIGFKFLVESYISHVQMNKPKYIKTTASESGLFDHLINVWEFNPGPTPGTCELHFYVDFKFQSPLYRQVASMFFKEVVSRLVGSFDDRCRRIYGPGVQVLDNSYDRAR